MRFLVVVCPACRRAQALESRFQRMTCIGCRKVSPVRDLKAFYRGDREAEAREAVMRVGAQVHGMDQAEFQRVLASLEPQPRASVDDVLRSLEARGEFSAEEFVQEMRRSGASGAPESVLEGLRAANRIFEPREGRWRVV